MGELALAGLCLTVAEVPFIPSLPFLLVPYLGILVLASALEGRWVLPAWGAKARSQPSSTIGPRRSAALAEGGK